MRKLTTIMGVLALLGSSTAFAGSCGAGKITHINDGGWNKDAFYIAIDFTVEDPATGGFFQTYWIRYQKASFDTEPDVYKGIKALAYMAFSTDRNVRAWVSGAGCGNASDLTILGPGQGVLPTIVPPST